MFLFLKNVRNQLLLWMKTQRTTLMNLHQNKLKNPLVEDPITFLQFKIQTLTILYTKTGKVQCGHAQPSKSNIIGTWRKVCQHARN